MQPNLYVMEWLVKLAACERQARVGEARPYLMPADHWGNHATDRVLTELYGK